MELRPASDQIETIFLSVHERMTRSVTSAICTLRKEQEMISFLPSMAMKWCLGFAWSSAIVYLSSLSFWIRILELRQK
ncbi:uncharacterized protein ColSpa_02470 [Colletotrichum spaethianum]|uniref:Uncharacterized protein n=1 Tax=Colletotrichum spaethianum TaxID=700344 RepID=A0AA37P765_9PEZI|nr:uncharacterized protein ColSpa_02470 [Colletotrichum spaethianum]GKT42289.1 hypothetical protein ColSpa_02470 [Colletotrichum spaethianum]